MIIDTHHHWIPKKHFETFEKYVTRPGESVTRDKQGGAHLWRNGLHLTGPTPLFYEMDRHLQDMDAAGIDMAVLQLPSWSEWNTVRLAPYINNCCAEIVARYPKRFVGLAHVPMEGKAAFKELERAVRELGLCGVGISTHFRGRSLDSERHYGFWEKAAELDIPVVIAPFSYPEETDPFWGFDIVFSYARLENVQRAMVRLIYGTLLDRFPTVKLLVPHLGAGYFGYMGRVAPSFAHYYRGDVDITELDRIEQQKARQIESHLSQLFFESAPPHWRPVEFKCAFDTYGEDKIVLGTDYPVGPNFLGPSVDLIQRADISQQAKQKILGENAASLFGIPGYIDITTSRDPGRSLAE